MWLTQILFLVFASCTFCSAAYDYKEVIEKSLLFYEAQRSGKLPADQKVTWRKDSGLNDKGDNGEDLTGGYYDAGDFVKFGLPMAFTTTMLSWGMISYEDAYTSTGLMEDARKTIKWATDYFLKCHVDDYVFYGQVGNGELDHAWWGRPEEMPMERPAYQINASAPGSDLAGETAAAFAAASIVFKEADPDYSATLLDHGKTMFDFANNYRDNYGNSITDVVSFYNSSDYRDEIVWAATWLYKATNDQQYLETAEKLYMEFEFPDLDWGGIDWSNKMSGLELLLAGYSDNPVYKSKVKGYLDWATTKADQTPKGLIFISEWGSLRLASNLAFLLLQAAEAGIGDRGNYLKIAKSQIDYALGDSGRSYVVGFGENPPSHEHHRSSSCPDAPATCDWDNYNSEDPNPQTLYGALVGGPDVEDVYHDNRSDYMHNEVACDYNAAFQSAVAGIIHLGLDFD